jgi:hypothetical protein
MNDSKKLKRGLKDISPLFNEMEHPPAQNISAPSFETATALQCLSVFSPHPEESLMLNSYFASKLSMTGSDCAIITLNDLRLTQLRKPLRTEAPVSHIKRLSLSWDQFEKVCYGPLPRRDSSFAKSRVLFMDFNLYATPYFEKLIPILDKWIFVVEPNAESLTESYKIIKASLSLNRHLEYFVLYRGMAQDSRSSQLFERFSDLISRKLGVHLGWLGSLELSKGSPISSELALDQLFLKSGEGTDSLEKRALAAFVQL